MGSSNSKNDADEVNLGDFNRNINALLELNHDNIKKSKNKKDLKASRNNTFKSDFMINHNHDLISFSQEISSRINFQIHSLICNGNIYQHTFSPKISEMNFNMEENIHLLKQSNMMNLWFKNPHSNEMNKLLKDLFPDNKQNENIKNYQFCSDDEESPNEKSNKENNSLIKSLKKKVNILKKSKDDSIADFDTKSYNRPKSNLNKEFISSKSKKNLKGKRKTKTSNSLVDIANDNKIVVSKSLLDLKMLKQINEDIQVYIDKNLVDKEENNDSNTNAPQELNEMIKMRRNLFKRKITERFDEEAIYAEEELKKSIIEMKKKHGILSNGSKSINQINNKIEEEKEEKEEKALKSGMKIYNESRPKNNQSTNSKIIKNKLSNDKGESQSKSYNNLDSNTKNYNMRKVESKSLRFQNQSSQKGAITSKFDINRASERNGKKKENAEKKSITIEPSKILKINLRDIENEQNNFIITSNRSRNKLKHKSSYLDENNSKNESNQNKNLEKFKRKLTQSMMLESNKDVKVSNEEKNKNQPKNNRVRKSKMKNMVEKSQNDQIKVSSPAFKTLFEFPQFKIDNSCLTDKNNINHEEILKLFRTKNEFLFNETNEEKVLTASINNFLSNLENL